MKQAFHMEVIHLLGRTPVMIADTLLQNPPIHPSHLAQTETLRSIRKTHGLL